MPPASHSALARYLGCLCVWMAALSTENVWKCRSIMEKDMSVIYGYRGSQTILGYCAKLAIGDDPQSCDQPYSPLLSALSAKKVLKIWI